MSSSGTRSLPWLGLVAALAVVALVFVLIGPDSAGDDADDLASGGRSALGDSMDLTPVGAGEPARELRVVDDPPAADVADEPAPALTWPGRSVRGRVVRDDGLPLPGDLQLFAASTMPFPRVFAASLSTIGEQDRRVEVVPDADVADVNRALRAATLTAVGPGGRFEMESVPTRGAWLVVDDARLYPREQAFVQPTVEGLDDEELVITLTLGGLIEGRVVDAEQRGVSGQAIGALTPIDQFAFFDGNRSIIELGEAESGADGGFRLTQVPVDQTYHVRSEGRAGWNSAVTTVAPLHAGETREVELQTARGATVAGLVVDEQGTPVPDVGLRMVSSSIAANDFGMTGAPPFLEEETDATGRFRFEGVHAGGWRLVVAEPGFQPVPGDVFEVAGDELRDDLRVVAVGGLALSGRVLDARGEPIRGARVLAVKKPNMMDMTTRLDRMYRDWVDCEPDGSYELGGYAAGAVQVSARGEGFMSATLDASAGDTGVDFALTRLTALRGIAMDLELGEPLTEYTLRALPGDGAVGFADIMNLDAKIEQRVPPTRVRHPEGRFRVEGVAPGEYRLLLTAEGYADTRLEGVVAIEGEETSGLILMVPPEARLEGLVLDEQDGAPVVGAKVTTGGVTIMSQVTSALSGPVPETRTDEEGRFSLGSLGDEPVTLSVTHSSYETWSQTDIAPRTGEVQDIGLVSLSRGARVFGTIRDDARQPLPEITVYVADPMGTSMKRGVTDADGFWSVEGLPAGSYNVTRMDMRIDAASGDPSSYINDLITRSITVERGEQYEVDLSGSAQQEGTRLQGTIRTSTGPAAKATVICVPERGQANVKLGSADEQGFYSLEGLQPGEHLLQVIPDLTEMGAGGTPMTPVVEVVDIGAGPTQVHDVRIPTGELHGEVTDARTGEGLEGVRVTLERAAADLPPSRFLAASGGRVGETYTDADGNFTFRHMPPSTYAVQAGGVNLLGLGRAGYAVTRVDGVEVREGRRTFRVEIALEPGGAVEGTLRDRKGRPLVNVPVWARNDTTGRWLSPVSDVSSDGDGSFRIEGLEPGTWTVAAGGDGHGLGRLPGLVVHRESVTRADLTLERGVEILVDSGEFQLRDLTAVVSDSGGSIPVHLSSLTGMLRPPPGDGLLRVGRLPKGSYQVTVLASGESVFSDQVTLGSEDPYVLELPTPQGEFVYDLF